MKTCGSYQVRLIENGFDDPEDSVSLVRNGKTYAKVQDVHVELNACTDLTGDGIPEAILTQFSGGAHCCSRAQIWTLSTPPRRILDAGLAHSSDFTITQLDGRGPKELITGDWRFAYAFDMSFADSPALPQIFGYRNGQYVDVTREFPQYLLKDLKPKPTDESGDALYVYSVYLMAGQPKRADAYLQSLGTRTRTWLQNYSPEIRQSLSSVGLEDWPTRSGWNEADYGIGGSFTRAGTLEYLTTVRQGGSSLRLFRQQGGKIIASPSLLSFATPPRDSTASLLPVFTVRRSSGRDDAVVSDSLNGTVKYHAYRIDPTGLTELQNDPLGATLLLLGQVEDLAVKAASLYRSSVKTDEQRNVIKARIQQALAKALPWQKKLDPSKTTVDFGKLGSFAVRSVEVSREDGQSALVAGVVELGTLKPDQRDEYVDHQRHTFAVFLEKKGGIWQVIRWQLTPRLGAGPLSQ